MGYWIENRKRVIAKKTVFNLPFFFNFETIATRVLTFKSAEFALKIADDTFYIEIFLWSLQQFSKVFKASKYIEEMVSGQTIRTLS